MQRSLFALGLTIIAFLNLTHASESETMTYQCNYSVTEEDGDDTEYVVIDISLAGTPTVVYTTTDLFNPLEFSVEKIETKSEFTHVYGNLPSPWAANSKYEIKLHKGSQTGILKVISAGIHRLNPIEMTCL